MADLLKAAQADTAVRTLLIAGQPGIFSSGNDLEDFMSRAPIDGDKLDESPVFQFMHALADFDKPGMVNCFWTALNFFNVDADDRYLDANVAIERLKRDYFIVHDQFQFGESYKVAANAPANNVFLVKASFWIPR